MIRVGRWLVSSIFVFGLMLVALGCGPASERTPARVAVVVRGDDWLLARARRIDVRTVRDQATFVLGPGHDALPLTFLIQQSDGADATSLVLEARGDAEEVLVTRYATVFFEPHKTLVLDLLLVEACGRQVCSVAELSVCGNCGVCESPVHPVGTLSVVTDPHRALDVLDREACPGVDLPPVEPMPAPDAGTSETCADDWQLHELELRNDRDDHGVFVARDVELVPEGFVVAGHLSTESGRFIAVARYDMQGRLDPAWNEGRIATVDFGESLQWASALTVHGETITVAGAARINAQNQFALARFTADGRRDLRFGVGGALRQNFLNSDEEEAQEVVVDYKDRILVAGNGLRYSPRKGFVAVARFSETGAPDPAFNGSGRVLVEANARVPVLALRGDTSEVFYLEPNSSRPHRIASTGVLDFEYGRWLDQAYTMATEAAIVTPDGVLHVFGKGRVHHLDPAGSRLMPGIHSSSEQGLVLSAIGLFYQPESRRLVALGTQHSDSSVLGLSAYAASRVAASTLGDSSSVAIELLDTDLDALQAAGLKDGRAVWIGTKDGHPVAAVRSQVLCARELSDDASPGCIGGGCPTANFSLTPPVKGANLFRLDRSALRPVAAAAAEDRLVTVAQSADARGMLVAAHRLDGAPAPEFHGGAPALIRVEGSAKTWPRAVALAEGKILLAGGVSSETGGARFVVARLLADGELDAGFGQAGMATADFAQTSEEEASALFVDSAGRITVAGHGSLEQLATDGSQSYFNQVLEDYALVARYLPDGRLDESFGQGGQVVSKARSGACSFAFDAAQAELYFLCAGESQPQRIDASGAVDPSYPAVTGPALAVESLALHRDRSLHMLARDRGHLVSSVAPDGSTMTTQAESLLPSEPWIARQTLWSHPHAERLLAVGTLYREGRHGITMAPLELVTEPSVARWRNDQAVVLGGTTSIELCASTLTTARLLAIGCLPEASGEAPVLIDIPLSALQ